MSVQASSNNLPTFYQLWKNPALIKIFNTKHKIYIYSTDSLHLWWNIWCIWIKSNMDFYYLGKLNQDWFGLL